MPVIIHGFRKALCPLEFGRLVYEEVPAPAPAEVRAEQVDKNILNVDLPRDLENAINEKTQAKVDELNAALTDLVASVGSNPQLKKIAAGISGEIATGAREGLTAIKENFKAEVGRVGTVKLEFEQVKDKFQASVDDFIAKLKAKTEKAKDKYDTEPEQAFEVAKLQLAEARGEDGLKIKEQMLNSLNGLDEWSQMKNESVKAALMPIVLAKMDDSIWKSENRDIFEAKAKQLFSQPEFWRRVLGEYQKDEPRISSEPLEEDLIQKTIKAEPDLAGSLGGTDLPRVSKAIAKQLNIVFSKNEKNEPVPIGFIDMGGEDRTFVTGPDCEQKLKGVITGIVRGVIDNNEKSDNPTQDYIDQANALETKDREARLAFQDTIGNYVGFGDSELDDLASVIDRSKDYRSFVKAQPVIEQLNAVTRAVPADATTEIRNAVAAITSRTPEQINSNPALRDGNILKQIVRLIQAMMGNKDALNEINGGIDRNENPDAKRNEALAKYGEILGKMDPKPNLQNLLEWHGASALPEKMAQGLDQPTKDLLANYQSTRAEAVRAYIGKQLGAGIEVTAIENDIMTLKKGNVSLKVKFEVSANKLMAKLVDAAQGVEATDVTSGAAEFVANLFKPKAAETQSAQQETAEAPTREAMLKALAELAKGEGLTFKKGKKFSEGASPMGELVNLVKGLKGKPMGGKIFEGKLIANQADLDAARVKFIEKNYNKFKDVLNGKALDSTSALYAKLHPKAAPATSVADTTVPAPVKPPRVGETMVAAGGETHADEPPPVVTSGGAIEAQREPEFSQEVNELFGKLKAIAPSTQKEPPMDDLGRGGESGWDSSQLENATKTAITNALLEQLSALKIKTQRNEPIPGLQLKLSKDVATRSVTATIDLSDPKSIIAIKNFIQKKFTASKFLASR